MLYSNFTITHFWPTSLVPFFLNHWKKNELPIPPNLVIWFLNVGPFMKLFTIFAMQLHGGNIKKCNCITQFCYVPLLPCKVGIKQYKKLQRTWWQPDHWTRFKTTDRTLSVRQFWQCNTPCHYHGKVPWPSDCPATTSLKNTHFHINSWSAWISEFQCTGKKSRAIFDPVNSGLSLPWFSLNVRGRECILV